MRRTAAMVAAAGALLLSACDAPTVPPRQPVYAFHLLGSPLVFHWPSGSEVRVFVQPSEDPGRDAGLRTAVAAGAAAWNEVPLFGEYRFTVVPTPVQADVVVRWSDADSLVLVPDPRCGFEIGRAVTTFCVSADGTRLVTFPLTGSADPGHVRFVVNISPTEAETENLLRVTAHELGHTLGLWQHPSPLDFPESVMLSSPSTATPTAVDRNTIQVLYHTRADVRP